MTTVSTHPRSVLRHLRRTTGLWLAIGLMAAGILFSIRPVAAAESNGSNQLTSIQATGLPGDRVQLEFQLSDAAPKPMAFTINQPARIAFDLANTHSALNKNSQAVNIGDVNSVMTAEANGRTRVVINLTEMVPYDIRTEGNLVYVTLGGSGAAVAQANSGTATFGPATTRSSQQPKTPMAPAADQNAISKIDFRRGTRGEGRVLITLGDPSTIADVHQEGKKVYVDFHNTTLPDKLQRRLDVLDFATPVKTIDATQKGKNTELVIDATNADFEQLAYQTDNLFAVELKPLTKQEVAQKKEKEYTGQKLTLNFQDIEVRAVLQILADFTGLNMVVSDSVKGNITLRLQNVPWDQALDIILQTKGLAMRKHGNVMQIAPAKEIADQEKLDLESKQSIQELLPLRSEFIQVNYAKANILAGLIKSQGNSLLSKRGSVTVDQRTNTLLVQDTEDHLADIRRLVSTLDIPVRQVLIESRIVIANSDFTHDLGVRFGATGVRQQGNNGLVSVSGSAAGNDVVVGSALDNLNSTGQTTPVSLPSLNNRLNVNLPVSSPAGTLAVAILNSDYLVDLELSALQAEGQGQVVSSPRVITANQKEATIEQGVEIPYQQSSSSGATTTAFKKAVLSLQVTPQITPDDRIIMDLTVNKDSVGQEVPSATGGVVPSIDTRRVNSQVLVDNGDTVVLGGIYETTQSEVTQKVPLLGDIPALGALFRNTHKVANKAELLIFVTPKILKQDLKAQ